MGLCHNGPMSHQAQAPSMHTTVPLGTQLPAPGCSRCVGHRQRKAYSATPHTQTGLKDSAQASSPFAAARVPSSNRCCQGTSPGVWRQVQSTIPAAGPMYRRGSSTFLHSSSIIVRCCIMLHTLLIRPCRALEADDAGPTPQQTRTAAHDLRAYR